MFFWFCWMPPAKFICSIRTMFMLPLTSSLPVMVRLVDRLSSVSCALATVATPAVAWFPSGVMSWFASRMEMPLLTKRSRLVRAAP